MKYRLFWAPEAFRRLQRAWRAANEPESGIRVFDEMEHLLSLDAHTRGESRAGDRRILIVPPLGVVFRARPESGEVLILDAWMIGKPDGWSPRSARPPEIASQLP